jgi:hypothetical protein
MIATTIASTAVWLVPFPPDGGIISASFALPVVRNAGKSNREHRMATAASLRASFSFATMLSASEAQTLRDFLRDMDNKPVVVPFWPAEALASSYAAASLSGTLRVWFEPDWSSWAITTTPGAASPLPVTETLRTCPLCWGRLNKAPVYGAANGLGDGSVSFDFMETGPAGYALTPRSVSLQAGAAIGGGATPPVFPIPVDWSSTPKQSTEIIVDRERIGFGRSEVEEYIPQAARRTQSFHVTALGSDEVAALLTLFATRGGQLSPWWCPAAHSEDSEQRLLVRFASDKLMLRWERAAFGGNEIASGEVSVVELPTERSLPGDEGAGTTLGALAAKWWGYVVTAGGSTYRYTSYEAAIDAGGLGVFNRAPIEHGDITKELNLARNECSLTVGSFAGSPFEILRVQPNGYEITVQIVEGTLASPASATPIFTGRLSSPSFSGSVMKAKIAGMASLFDMQVPVQVASKRCWAPLYSTPCGVARVGTPAQLESIGVNGILSFSVSGSFGADYFRYGYAEKSGASARLSITSSSAGGPGTIAVNTNGVFPTPPSFPDAGWVLYPGCDHSFERCKILGGKFRGFPRFPKANPALVPVKQSTPSTGKK